MGVRAARSNRSFQLLATHRFRTLRELVCPSLASNKHRSLFLPGQFPFPSRLLGIHHSDSASFPAPLRRGGGKKEGGDCKNLSKCSLTTENCMGSLGMSATSKHPSANPSYLPTVSYRVPPGPTTLDLEVQHHSYPMQSSLSTHLHRSGARHPMV